MGADLGSTLAMLVTGEFVGRQETQVCVYTDETYRGRILNRATRDAQATNAGIAGPAYVLV